MNVFLKGFRSFTSTMYYSRSITHRIGMVIWLCVFSIMFLLDSLYFYSVKTELKTNLTKSAAEITERLSVNFAGPLKRKDYIELDRMLSQEMKEPSVVALSVYLIEDKSAKTYFIGKRKNREFYTIPYSPITDRLETFGNVTAFQKNINYENKVIGTADLEISDYFIHKNLSKTLIDTLMITFILSVLIVLVLYFMMKAMIIDPIVHMDGVVKSVSSKNINPGRWDYSRDEIGRLSRNINTMAESLQTYNEEILHQLYTDSLTGIPNRRKILRDIEIQQFPNLILMNIDYFKEVNDFYGNIIGDLVLVEMTSRLKEVREDLKCGLYRMSGDEFALLIDRMIGSAELEQMIKTIGEKINERSFIIKGIDIHVSVTIGAAAGFIPEADPIKEGKWSFLATQADMALKKAKKMQKSFLVYDRSMEIPKEYGNNIIWKEKLKEAIREERIIAFYQPIINNLTGKIEKYESLVRLRDERGNIITPHYFLDIAKKTHLYGEITKAMMRRSFDMFRKTEYEFSINLTVFDILDEELNRHIIEKLKNEREMANQVVFEILESEGIENYKEVMIFIEEAKEIGCKIAIDDFGSGYSNFEHILRLDVDYIKIDSSLIRNIDVDTNSQIITKTIASFAKELGLKTISEFVHSKEVYEKAVGLGVDFSQGYYFGEPSDILQQKGNNSGFRS